MVRCRSAFVLPATIALLVVLAVAMVSLNYLQNSHATQSQKLANSAHLELAASLASADFASILQGESGLPAGVSVKLTPVGGPVQDYGFADPGEPDVRVQGSFNAKKNPSLHNPVPAVQGQFSPNGDLATADLYDNPAVADGRIAVPARHSLFLFSTTLSGAPSQFAALYSANFPYAMLAPLGSISLREARSVYRHRGSDQDDAGLPVNLGARQGLDISGFFYGHAYAPPAAKMRLGPTGFAVACKPPALPESLRGLAGSLAPLLSRDEVDFGPTIQGNPSPLASLQGSTFQVNTSFGLYPSQAMLIPFDTHVGGDLVVENESTLHIRGNLTVQGHLYMGNRSSLLVDGDLTVQQTLDLYQISGPNQGITTSVVALGQLNLPAGMSQTPAMSSYSQDDVNELSAYLRVVETPLASRNDEVPGALLVSGRSCQLGQSDATSIRGLVVAADSVVLRGPMQLVGAAYAETGDIQGAQTRFGHFPYFTHAFVHSSGQDTHLSTTLYHRTGFGQL